MSTEKIFFEPKLEGQRFDDHTLPVNILEDFTAFGELVFELSKNIYLEQNPSRKRVPKGFTDNVHLKLSKIEEGSTILKILICTYTSLSSPTIVDSNSKYINYFEQARDKVFELVENANHGKSTKIDSKYLNYFNRIGKNLEEGESIDFLNSISSDRNVRFNRNTRRKILLSREEKLEYSEVIQENVLISSIDKKEKRFRIELNGFTYEYPLIEDFYETINFAFREYEKKALISIKAVGVFNKDGKLIHIEDIESMDILDPFDVSVRLNELLKLNDKWYEGTDGIALNQHDCKQFEYYFQTYFDFDLRLPAIFPTLEGDILLEWKKENIDISVEVKLNSLMSTIFKFNLDDDNDDSQINIDLKTFEGWNILNKLISQNIS